MAVKKYRVSALVTISIHADVKAESKKEAVELARDLPMQRLCHQCAGGGRLKDEQWNTSGELDGEAKHIKAEEV